METIKQIVYREEDGVLMIIPNNPDSPIVPRFIKDLSTEGLSKIEMLREFALTKAADIKYLVYKSEENTLDLESADENITLDLSELGDDTPIADALLLCTQLINI